ncbi:hypothetical protein BG004_006334 [Podila humilis]|nr:hypothetical protein BG004_006334 [Podila humilis]
MQEHHALHQHISSCHVPSTPGAATPSSASRLPSLSLPRVSDHDLVAFSPLPSSLIPSVPLAITVHAAFGERRAFSTLDSGSGTMTVSPNSDVEHKHLSSTAIQSPAQTQLLRHRPQTSDRLHKTPSPLAIPEVLQHICLYLDTTALIRASQVSRAFHICCDPLIWTHVPEGAWRNAFFRANWSFHADKIRSLVCTPFVNLSAIAQRCHKLIFLDVSKVLGRTVIMDNGTLREPNYGGPVQDDSKEHTKQSRRIGFIAHSGTRTTSPAADALLCTGIKSISSHNTNSIRPKGNCTYRTFHDVVKDLVVLLKHNPSLQCLQMQPQGVFPRALLTTLAELKDLCTLVMDDWLDFHEYSLQLILESCHTLEHLIMGKNDFTPFTLSSIALTSALTRYQQHLKLTSGSDTTIRLQRFDDPHKSTDGRMPLKKIAYVDPDMRDLYATQAALAPSSSSDLTATGSFAFQQHLHKQSKQHQSDGTSSSSQTTGSSQTTYTQYSLVDRPTAAASSSLQQHYRQTQSPSCQTRIRSLNLDHSGFRQDFLLNLLSQCPQLEQLSFKSCWGLYPSSKFVPMLRFICPELRQFQVRDQVKDLQDTFFIQLIEEFSGQLDSLHAEKTGFSQSSLVTLLKQQQHHGSLQCQNQARLQQDLLLLPASRPFKSLVSLNLDAVRGLQSKTLVQLLEVCSDLCVFSAQGVVLNGRDLFKPKSTSLSSSSSSFSSPANVDLIPWSCLRLETLVIDFAIYAAASSPVSSSSRDQSSQFTPVLQVSEIRKGIYQQLASLTRLQHLGLGGGHSVRGETGENEPGVDCTLESGLAALEGLQCLESLDVHRLMSRLKQVDLAWMVLHWSRLRKITAKKDKVIADSRHAGHMNKAFEWLAATRPGIDLLFI